MPASENKKTIKKQVYLGMSGGVDSSVSAALLLQAGYDVTGVFIKVWHPDFLPCNWQEERLDAMRVAAKLGIPFRFLDLEEEYKKNVADYMIAEYRAGRTPNPDVMCNKEVKFGAFYRFARKEGADFVATGHYAIQETGTSRTARLFVSRDANKDQSYFLWTLPQEVLQHVLFPIGHLEKPEVRRLAQVCNLPTAQKKDSQGLCFVGKIDLEEFLSHFIERKQGAVLDENGKEIGTHPGAFFFTIGERHGFTVTEKTPDDAPLYVSAKDNEKNTLTVSRKKTVEKSGGEKNFSIKDTNWIAAKPAAGKTYAARYRYRQPLLPCTVVLHHDTKAQVTFLEGTPAAAPGQSLVLYDGEECLGGGIIE